MAIKFLNISNHAMTQDQITELAAKGYEVTELPQDLKDRWSQCDPETYTALCKEIMDYMDDQEIYEAMLAGYPAAVVYMCVNARPGVTFFYAHTKRVSVEEQLADGSVVKRNVFKHEGFHVYDIVVY